LGGWNALVEITRIGGTAHRGGIASNKIAVHNGFHPAQSRANLMMLHFISRLGTSLVDQVNG
jgi:hypothetical protein